MMKNYAESVKTNQYPNWPYISDHTLEIYLNQRINWN